jgi:hypothetical protein
MRYLLLIVFIAFLLCLCQAAKADDEASLHLAAHLGVSYALDTALVGFNAKAFRMEPLQAEVFAGVTTLFIGVLYKAAEVNASTGDTIRATSQNALGIGLSVLTRMVFTYNF